MSGATLGAISGLASGDDNSGGWFSYTKEEKAIGTGVFLGIVGVGVGAGGVPSSRVNGILDEPPKP